MARPGCPGLSPKANGCTLAVLEGWGHPQRYRAGIGSRPLPQALPVGLQCQSATDRRRSRIVPFPATGLTADRTATCWAVPKNGHVATRVERSSRFVMPVKASGKESDRGVGTPIRPVPNLPQGLMAVLTWRRGTERAYHRKFTVATDVNVSFRDPQSPWPRRNNENANGLRRYD